MRISIAFNLKTISITESLTLGELEPKKKIGNLKIFSISLHLKHLLRLYLSREKFKILFKILSLLSELTFSGRKLCIKQKVFRAMNQCPENQALDTEPWGPRMVGNALQGEIAASFPISQKLNGGNKISEVVWMIETRELDSVGVVEHARCDV